MLGGHMLESKLETFVKVTTTDEQEYQEAAKRAQEMESVRNGELATLGQTFIRDANKANAFSKLSRYETTPDATILQ